MLLSKILYKKYLFEALLRQVRIYSVEKGYKNLLFLDKYLSSEQYGNRQTILIYIFVNFLALEVYYSIPVFKAFYG